MFKIFNILVLTLILGCSEQYIFRIKGDSKTIFGKVVQSNIVQGLNLSCTKEVSLNRLNKNGDVESVVATASVDDNGDFSFIVDADYELDQNVDHILEASFSSECHQEGLSRPLTRIENKQVISSFSTLVTYSQRVSGARKLTELSKLELEKILSKQVTSNDFNSAFEIIENDSAIFNEIFGIEPEQIKDVAPAVSYEFQEELEEKQLKTFSLEAGHWDKNYDIAYEWYLDGVLISNEKTWNAFFGANGSGPKIVEVWVGRADNGSVNRDAPHFYTRKTIQVKNTILPVAPQVSLDSLYVKDQTLAVKVHTGPGLSECESFSAFAITTDNMVPVDFNYSCLSPVVQIEEITLSNEGPQKVRLFVKDSEGKISFSNEVSFYFDETSPSIAISFLSERYKGGSNISFQLDLVDEYGIENAIAFIKSGGDVTSEVVVNNGATTIPLPLWNTANAVVVIKALDRAANLTVFESVTFEIDSTAPATPAASVASIVPQNKSVVDFNVANCSQAHQISFSTTLGSYNWQNCSGLMSAETGVNLDGTKNVYIYFKDEVGNISSAQTLAVLFDFTPPQIEIAFSGKNPGLEENISLGLKSCSDVESYSISLDEEFSTWVSCGSSYSLSVSAASGAKIIRAQAKDLAGNLSEVTSFTYYLDKTPPEFEKMVINPDESGVGATYAKTIFVNVELEFNEEHPGSKVAFQMADGVTNNCLAPVANLNWETVQESGLVSKQFSSQVSTGDGVKKLCAYIEDAAGNTSFSSLGELENINFDKINFETGNIPQIAQFYINKLQHDASAGENLEVKWNISDVEGLANGPVSIEYTTDNTDWVTLLDKDGTEIKDFGELENNPTNYSGSVVFEAPSSSYFRLRLQAVDMAGNDSLMAYSQSFNTSAWSIFAGSPDKGIGSGPLSTSLKQSPNYGASSFVFDSQRGDLYIKTIDAGLIRIKGSTGKSETVIGYSSTSLPDDGVVSGASKISMNFNFAFGRDGLLYINAAVSNHRSKIYKFNPDNSHLEWVAGGGNSYSDLSNAKGLNTHYGQIALDEEGSIYSFLMCITGTTSNLATTAYKLVKITKSGVVHHVAGDCSRNSLPALGTTKDAIDYSLGVFTYPQMGDLSVKDKGNVIYLSAHGQGYIAKIFNGKISRSNMSVSGMSGLYFGADGYLYVSRGAVYKYAVSEAHDSLVEEIISNDYQRDGCNNDFKKIDEACAVSHFRPGFTASGQLMFADGPIVNGPRLARIRYISDKNEVLTFAGTKALYGEDLDKSVLRGSLGSIYYQQSSTANSEFPEGLYFGAPEEAAIFRIDPAGKVHRHLGSGLGVNQFSSLSGRTLSPNISLGAIYTAGHSGALFNFYNGYMYLRSGNEFYRVGEDLLATRLMSGGQTWDNISVNASPSQVYLTATNLMHNIAIKDGGIFLAGAAASSTVDGVTTTTGNNSSSLRFMDFMNDEVVHIMGGTGTNAHLPDIEADTDLRSMHFNSSYTDAPSTFTAYDSHSDRLFFIEKGRWLRYITAPTTHSSQLITVKDSEGDFSFRNLTVHPEGHSLYVVQSGRLYCYSLNSNAPQFCNGATMLGPSSGLPTISSVVNQFAWRDNNTLLISNDSVILELQLNKL